MPRKATRKSAALKQRSWALSPGLVTRMEKEATAIGKTRPEIQRPPSKEEMTELFAKLAANKRSGTVITHSDPSDVLAAETTTPMMSLLNQVSNKGGSSTINTPMPVKEVKAWEPIIDFPLLYTLQHSRGRCRTLTWQVQNIHVRRRTLTWPAQKYMAGADVAKLSQSLMPTYLSHSPIPTYLSHKHPCQYTSLPLYNHSEFRMAAPIPKRRISQPIQLSLQVAATRTKRARTAVQVIPTMIDSEGYVNDTTLESFMPSDMAKWLPKVYVDLLVASQNAEEWRGKLFWLAQVLYNIDAVLMAVACSYLLASGEAEDEMVEDEIEEDLDADAEVIQDLLEVQDMIATHQYISRDASASRHDIDVLEIYLGDLVG
ncbi:hypothetical protein L211DRAFT_854364 [Terfezia boudieri ATCC MYA-4762]|uniref:Uncharacterized protein n=1 Tax=Terfezia boudieri ATCC MYA-4762 TaxID=1051890 RepID=A0A3N4L6I1_9PEZI|nr:hypothetical protein L211DRAFT_854364 [Terfezia boudieri ATCC MYA-4762]